MEAKLFTMNATALKTHTFKHGIHPPQNKDETNRSGIKHFPFAPVLVVPLSQHVGAPAVPVVIEGQEVTRGQLIAKANGFVSVPMHAPATGIIKKIAPAPTISGKMTMAIYLEPFPGSGQEVMDGTPLDVDKAPPDEIIQAIQDAGIVGLGGAAFPTHVKLKPPKGKHADTLIINGVECEPYLTTDHRVMLEQSDAIFQGIRYLLKASGTERVIIGIEANKPDAIAHLRSQIPPDLPLTVEALDVKYPQGAEKMLISALLGKEVPSGGLPVDIGAIVVNVSTTAEIGHLLPLGRGIQERVITMTGPGINKKGNYWIPLGTPLRFVLEYIGIKDNLSEVFLGGPMMGTAVSSLDIPITKGTSGFVAFTEDEISSKKQKIYPCIHCGACVEACPLFLNPSKMGILAHFGAYDKMVAEYNLMDCFECGSCTFVCPSHIPLVQYFRMSKGIIRKRKAKA